jgi:hypothetical protein
LLLSSSGTGGGFCISPTVNQILAKLFGHISESHSVHLCLALNKAPVLDHEAALEP